MFNRTLMLLFTIACLAIFVNVGHSFINPFSCALRNRVATDKINNHQQNSGSSSILKATTVDTTTVSDGTTEKFSFESNVSRVMDIIINSLYSNKDVFIRELISNAADACDKKRFLSLTDGQVATDLGIRVYPDRQKMTLTIEDRGIGIIDSKLNENLF